VLISVRDVKTCARCHRRVSREHVVRVWRQERDHPRQARQRPTGTVDLRFQAHFTRFINDYTGGR
jgi:hypothetical protein